MVETVFNSAIVPNTSRQSESGPLFALFTPQALEPAQKLLDGMGHTPTPLRNLDALAARWGLGGVRLKDESRFFLGAFKARGSLWAMSAILDDLRKKGAPADSLLFVTATDGNHGKGVAFAARHFGQRAHVFMPKGSAGQIVEEIRSLGAQCEVLPHNYDGAVRAAHAFAQKQGAILLQDTAWPGYEAIPALIMQGYGTLFAEIRAHLDSFWPDYVLLQVGVGSLAAAMIAAFVLEAKSRGVQAPKFVSLEPLDAACLFRSIQAGSPQSVGGDLASVMNGLSCGEVSSLAWPALRDNLFAACACGDELARDGMRLLAGEGVSSGPSGAIGAGFLDFARRDDTLRHLIGAGSKVLLISTEGARQEV